MEASPARGGRRVVSRASDERSANAVATRGAESACPRGPQRPEQASVRKGFGQVDEARAVSSMCRAAGHWPGVRVRFRENLQWGCLCGIPGLRAPQCRRRWMAEYLAQLARRKSVTSDSGRKPAEAYVATAATLLLGVHTVALDAPMSRRATAAATEIAVPYRWPR